MSVYEDVGLSYRVIATVQTVAVGLVGLTGGNFVYTDLPVALHNIILRFEVGYSINKTLLQTFCVPIEFMLQMQPVMVAGMGVGILCVSIDVLKTYCECLR